MWNKFEISYLLRSLICPKLMSHETHLKFLWPWWTNCTCLVRFPIVAKVWAQNWHWICTFSWFLLKWLVSWSLLVKPSPQVLHTKFLRPSWIAWTCLLSAKFEPNVFLQVGQGITAMLNLFWICFCLHFKSDICVYFENWECHSVTK